MVITEYEAMSNFEMSSEKIRRAYPVHNRLDIEIINPPHPGVYKNQYLAQHTIATASDVMASTSAVESMYCTQDDTE